MRSFIAVFAILAVSAVSAKVYFEENFDDDSWEKNWIYSEHPDKKFGKFKLTAGKFYGDEKEDQECEPRVTCHIAKWMVGATGTRRLNERRDLAYALSL